MTTTAPSTTTTRFRYVDDVEDIIYVGEAEIEDGDVNFLSVWRHGLTSEEVYPYTPTFPVVIRRMLEITAKEQAMCPPAAPVELPTDWDEIKILDAETMYLLELKAILPEVKTDGDAAIFGLRAVSRVTSINGGKRYRVIARGGIDDVRRELHRIRIF